MSRLIFCIFLLCSKMLFSQTETKEAFLNQVYKDFIPEDYRYFYVKTPYIPRFFHNKKDIHFLKGTPFFEDAEDIMDAIDERKKSSVPSQWDFQQLEKARECSQDSLLTFFFKQDFIYTKRKLKDKERFIHPHTFLVTVKWYWGDKRRKKEAQKVYEKCKELIYEPEKNQCYSFSEPIFFKGGNKAYITFRSSNKEIESVYKKENGLWKEDYSEYRHICTAGFLYPTTYSKEKRK